MRRLEVSTFREKYADAVCISSEDNRPTVVLRDKRQPRKFIGKNPDGKLFLTVYQVDGKLIASDVRSGKCDFAIYTSSDTLYLIELKGADYVHALEQIHDTIVRLVSSDVKVKVVNARVVLSKVQTPALRSSVETKLTRLLQKYKGDLQKASVQMQETLK